MKRIKRMSRRKKIILVLLLTVLAPALLVAGLNGWVLASAGDHVYANPAGLPANDVGLLLGVGRQSFDGRVNVHFTIRTRAAAQLYREGKIRAILVSGDNHVQGYDEPSDLRAALVALGVPERAITLDYAGFRTLDSVIRAKDVFGLDRMTIITDDFHAHRAVFLARQRGIEAVAFHPDPLPMSLSRLARVREVGARVKAWLDVFVLDTQPTFRGPPVAINGL